jgi:predicted Zn finger-like uncharacterized protein
MIEIQCTSCHTRYRIDERVLPADSPTFKCSRCGHVFTSDPMAAKSTPATEPAPPLKPASSRVPTPPKAPEQTSVPDAPKPEAAPTRAEPIASAPKPEAVLQTPKPPPFEESKPTPIRPYIRNQRPAMRDRSEPAPAANPPRPQSATSPSQSRPSSQADKPDAFDRPIDRHGEGEDDRENLAFDFNEMPELGPEPGDDDSARGPEKWSVGDEAPEEQSPPTSPRESGLGRIEPAERFVRTEPAPAFNRGEPDPGFSRGEPAPIGRGTIPQYAGIPRVQRSPLPDDAAFIERSEFHSARSFLGLFFAMALVFVIITLVIYGIPTASASLLRRMPVIGPQFENPATLESMVTVSDVQSSYQKIKDGHRALVLTGVAKNTSELPLHMVRVEVRLLDSTAKEIVASEVYCGTTLAPRMIGEMTPHELEFLQKLDPQKSFTLEAGHAAPFLMVFVDPPSNVSRFAVAISKAIPSATSATASN